MTGAEAQAALEDALQGTDAVRIRHGSIMDNWEKVVFEETDPDEIRILLDHLKLNPASPFFAHGCAGMGPTILEFCRDRYWIARFCVVHYSGLQWAGRIVKPGVRWPNSDLLLTEDSAGWICDWLEKRGESGPKEERKRMRK